MLVDKHGRKHNYLRISLTERCNLRCTYCMPENGVELTPKSHLMSKEEVLQIAKTFVDNGVNKIRLTGGEPLVRKDFNEIVTELSKLDVELCLTTNGVLVDRFIPLFKAVGLKNISVSLDTLDSAENEQLTRRSYHQKVLNNIQLLLNNGFNVKVNVVGTKLLDNSSLFKFINYTKENNVSIKFIEFMPFSGNDWSWDKGISSQTILDQIKGEFGEIELLENPPNSTSENYKIKGFKGRFATISTVTKPFCSSCNRLRLTADGKLKNCLFDNNEANLLGELRSGNDIIPSVKLILGKKHKQRAGMDSFQDFSKQENFENNRSMITIGG